MLSKRLFCKSFQAIKMAKKLQSTPYQLKMNILIVKKDNL
jgi:hypothetical protein